MAWFRSSTILGESQNCDSGSDDLFGDECQKGGKAVTDDAAEGRALGNRVIRSREEAEIEENSPRN